jgi:hypothetical protein
MRGISQLRRGRSMISRTKRLHLRRRQPRFAGKALISAFRAKPRQSRPKQPYLGSGVDLTDLLR